MITRRSFLALTAMAAASHLLPAQEPRSLIFEDAIKDVSIRQEYITQLVKETIPPDYLKYIHDIVYDHNRAIVKREILRLREEEFCSIPASKFCADEGAKSFFLSREAMMLSYRRDLQTANAMTFSDAWSLVRYGGGKKSNIFIFPSMFTEHKRHPVYQTYRFKRFNIAPMAVADVHNLKAVLIHESHHAKYKAVGIDFGHGVLYNGTKNPFLSERMAQYLNECESYLAGAYAVKHLGEMHTAYHDQVDGLARYVALTDPPILNDHDKDWLAYEWSKIESIRKDFPLLDELLAMVSWPNVAQRGS